jgi:hypothetical protein
LPRKRAWTKLRKLVPKIKKMAGKKNKEREREREEREREREKE